MRRTVTWLCLVALLIAGAVAASTASAAEYELEGLPAVGRCVTVPSGTGEYKGGHCVTSAGGKGTHDFLAGPGPKPKFKGTIGVTRLETVGKKYVVACSSGTATGEYTGQKTAKVTLVLLGCVNELTLQKCQTTPLKESAIEPPAIEGELGFIKGGVHPKVGLDLKPSVPITFSCGVLPEAPTSVSVEGSAIGLIAPTDSMRTVYKLTYAASGGKQNPEKFESGLKDTLSLTRMTGFESTTEQVGLTIIGTQPKLKPLFVEDEEKVEIKAK